MGHEPVGRLELPVEVELARAALDEVVDAHALVSARRSGADGVDVVGRLRERRGEEKVRLHLSPGDGGTSVLEHGAWGLRGVGSAELHQGVVDDLAERLRAAVARALVAGTPEATAAYVGTVVGGEGLDIETGRSVAVVIGSRTLGLRRGDVRHDLAAAELLEVEAVPVTTPGMPWDRELLTRVAARSSVGAVLGIATTVGLEALVHVGGSTTSVVHAELARLRAAAHPTPAPVVAPARRRAPGAKRSATELVREMAALAELHRDGTLDEDAFFLAKAELLGTANA